MSEINCIKTLSISTIATTMQVNCVQPKKYADGKYRGYQNSLDTKENMTIESLVDSLNEIELILSLQELNGYYVNLKPFGEPKLGKYNLYPNINAPALRGRLNNSALDNCQQLNQTMHILNYSGNIQDICM